MSDTENIIENFFESQDEEELNFFEENSEQEQTLPQQTSSQSLKEQTSSHLSHNNQTTLNFSTEDSFCITEDENEEYEVTKVANNKKTAEVWKYFNLNTEKHPACIKCGQVFSKKTGNSSLERHLKNHKIELNKNKQSTLKFQIINPYSPLEQSERDFAILKWIITNQQPFSIVENTDFRAMITKFDPRYKFLNRATVKSKIMELYKEKRNLIIQDLNKIPGKVSLTSDMWTSMHTNEAYLGITIHYINIEWKLCHFLLDIIPFQDKHTGENMAKEILQILHEFNLENKILGLTTDNASSMIKCGKIIKQELIQTSGNNNFNHYRCAAHILNLAAQKGIEILSCEIIKVRELMTKIKKSIILCDKLRALCNMKELTYLKPELDIATRWNSTYYMLQKLVKIDSALRLLIVDHTNLHILYPNEEEWKNIKVYNLLVELIIQEIIYNNFL